MEERLVRIQEAVGSIPTRSTRVNMPKDTLEKIAAEVQACTKCVLWKSRTNAVPGEGPKSAKIMLIGQAPGRMEDMTGRPFVGRAGEFLNQLLADNGIDRKKTFITSSIKCFPPGNRKPKAGEIAACRPYLERQIKLINPKIIVLMGRVAQKAVPKALLKGRRVIRTYHPAAGMRFPKIGKKMAADFRKIK